MTVWYAEAYAPAYQSHSHRIKSAKCRINTVVSPDDGHIVAQNMWRLTNILSINVLRKNCAPSWHYLQEQFQMFSTIQYSQKLSNSEEKLLHAVTTFNRSSNWIYSTS